MEATGIIVPIACGPSKHNEVAAERLRLQADSQQSGGKENEPICNIR